MTHEEITQLLATAAARNVNTRAAVEEIEEVEEPSEPDAFAGLVHTLTTLPIPAAHYRTAWFHTMDQRDRQYFFSGLVQNLRAVAGPLLQTTWGRDEHGYY